MAWMRSQVENMSSRNLTMPPVSGAGESDTIQPVKNGISWDLREVSEVF